ncbi:MAG: hypothetical protein QOG51_77 [Verrucomicrobiota bacterium]|jgi:hypothetical protein
MIAAASIFDHPVILIVVVAASILRWLWQKSQAEKTNAETPAAPDPPVPRAEAQTEEERIRRFMEALGQPVSSRPPPPVVPRTSAPRQTVLPPLPPLRSPLPRLKTVPPPLPPSPASISGASQPPQLPRRIFQPAPVQDAGFEVRDLDAASLQDPSRAAAKPQENLMLNLTSREGLRSAIVLREIFGPPRSLQSLDVMSGGL